MGFFDKVGGFFDRAGETAERAVGGFFDFTEGIQQFGENLASRGVNLLQSGAGAFGGAAQTAEERARQAEGGRLGRAAGQQAGAILGFPPGLFALLAIVAVFFLLQK